MQTLLLLCWLKIRRQNQKYSRLFLGWTSSQCIKSSKVLIVDAYCGPKSDWKRKGSVPTKVSTSQLKAWANCEGQSILLVQGGITVEASLKHRIQQKVLNHRHYLICAKVVCNVYTVYLYCTVRVSHVALLNASLYFDINFLFHWLITIK